MRQRMEEMRQAHMQRMQANRQAMPMMGPRGGMMNPEMMQQMQEMRRQRMEMMQANRAGRPMMGAPVNAPQAEAAAQAPGAMPGGCGKHILAGTTTCSAKPPVMTMPLSMMSLASSGGVSSSTARTAVTTC